MVLSATVVLVVERPWDALMDVTFGTEADTITSDDRIAGVSSQCPQYATNRAFVGAAIAVRLDKTVEANESQHTSTQTVGVIHIAQRQITVTVRYNSPAT